MIEVSDKRFAQLVGLAIDEIPDELAARTENVAFVVVDEPDDDEDGLLGLYTGIPLTERVDYSAVTPDVIEIYKGPLCRMCNTDDEIVEEVRITVIHELAHHFGIDDEKLDELGWS